MKLLLSSDSPDANSAYAIQAWALALALTGAGHEVIYNGQTYCGMPRKQDGVLIVGNLGILDPLGSLLLLDYYAEEYDVDAILTIKDPHVYPADYMRNLKKPWIALAELDTEPPARALVDIVCYATRVITPTRIGQEALQKVGVISDYAPHAVDCDFFTPGDGQDFRKEHGIPKDAFVLSVVKANRDDPSRGSLDVLLYAWKAFLDKRRDSATNKAILALHTDISGRAGGVHMAAIIEFLGIPKSSLFITDQADYQAGLGRDYLRDLYRASDWFYAASMGEGFHVGMIEAASCGVPAIVTAFTALRETVCGGIIIPTDKGPHYGERFFHKSGGYRFRPTQVAVASAIEAASNDLRNASQAENTRKLAQRYDSKRVFDEYWIPLFVEIEGQLKEAKFEQDH